MKYVYPAIFTPIEDGAYLVNFPDIDGCSTFGENINDAMYMAEDASCLMLYDLEVDGKERPVPTPIQDIKTKDGEFTTLIHCDTDFYRRFYKSKAVKKTLTIPEWMNEAAIAAGLNFSQVLQDALSAELSTAR